MNILCICISLVFCGSKLQQNCLYTKTRFLCVLQHRFQGKQLTIRAFLLSCNSTSGSRWRPFWNTLLTQLTSNFRSGTISDIHQHVKNYLSTKFRAFNRKWTIPAHIRPTSGKKSFHMSAQIVHHTSHGCSLSRTIPWWQENVFFVAGWAQNLP